MKNIFTAILRSAILTALIPLGCSRNLPPTQGYGISLVNATQLELRSVAVYYGDTMAFEKSPMAKGEVDSTYPVILPIPQEAEVRWTDRGVAHAVKVKLEEIALDPSVKMNMYFIIKDDEAVTFRRVRKDDDKGNQEATQGL